jgi:hypothetical protein
MELPELAESDIFSTSALQGLYNFLARSDKVVTKERSRTGENQDSVLRLLRAPTPGSESRCRTEGKDADRRSGPCRRSAEKRVCGLRRRHTSLLAPGSAAVPRTGRPAGDLPERRILLASVHPETPDGHSVVFRWETSNFSLWQGNQGVARRRTSVRRTIPQDGGIDSLRLPKGRGPGMARVTSKPAD